MVLFFEKGAPTRNIWYYQLDLGCSLGKTNSLYDYDLKEFVKPQDKFTNSDNSRTINIADVDTEVIINEIETLDRESEEFLEGIRGML